MHLASKSPHPTRGRVFLGWSLRCEAPPLKMRPSGSCFRFGLFSVRQPFLIGRPKKQTYASYCPGVPFVRRVSLLFFFSCRLRFWSMVSFCFRSVSWGTQATLTPQNSTTPICNCNLPPKKTDDTNGSLRGVFAGRPLFFVFAVFLGGRPLDGHSIPHRRA